MSDTLTLGEWHVLWCDANAEVVDQNMINGVARYGVPDLMAALVPPDETVRVAGQTRRLFLKQETADPAVAAVSLRTATARLKTALRDLKKLARELEKPKSLDRRTARPLDAPARPVWTLALDEIRDTGVELRPRLPFSGRGISPARSANRSPRVCRCRRWSSP